MGADDNHMSPGNMYHLVHCVDPGRRKKQILEISFISEGRNFLCKWPEGIAIQGKAFDSLAPGITSVTYSTGTVTSDPTRWETALWLRKPEGVSINSNRPVCPSSVWDTHGIVVFPNYCRVFTLPNQLTSSTPWTWVIGKLWCFCPKCMDAKLDGRHLCHSEGFLNRGFSLLPSAGVTAWCREGKNHRIQGKPT